MEKALPVKQLPTPAKKHLRGSFLFPSFGTKIKDTQKPRECTEPIAEPLEFLLQVKDIDRTAKLTYKLRIFYEPTTTEMRAATTLLDTGAEVNLHRSSMIPEE